MRVTEVAAMGGWRSRGRVLVCAAATQGRLGALSIGLCASAACAQAADADKAVQLDPVEVVGTTPLQSVKSALKEFPGNIQSASAKQVGQQGALNLGEFLDNNLGSVNSSNSLGNPYQMDISYRGFTASPVLGTAVGLSVFVDGVRVNEPFGDLVNWDLIPTNAIADIDLIPGSNPLFGFNTLGGAIAINTKDGANFPGTHVDAHAGSWGRRVLQGEYGAVDDGRGLDYYAAINAFHEDGYREYNRSDVSQVFSKVRWHDVSSTLDLSLSLADNTLNSTSVLPLSMLGNPTRAYTAPDFSDNRLALVQVKASHRLAPDQLLEGDVYFRLSNSMGGNSNASCDPSVTVAENCVAHQSRGDLDASNVISTTDQRGYGAAVQLSLTDDRWRHKNRLTFGGSVDASNAGYASSTHGANLIGAVTRTILPSGADAINQTGSNPYDQGGTSLTSTTHYYGLFATDDFKFDDQWNLTLSARFNFATVDLEGATTDGSGNLSPLYGNHDYHRLNPAIGLNFNPTHNLTLYGSYNEGMRVPTPVELSCANPALPCALPTGFTSDPNLNMIVSKTWEAGARGKLSRDVGWDAAVYNTVNQNDIQFIANGADAGVTGYFKNVGQTQRRGLELGLHGRFSDLMLAARYGLVNATFQSRFVEASPENSSADVNGNITVSNGNRIPGIARQTLKLRADCDVTPRWDIGATVYLTGGQFPHGDENNQNVNGTLGGYGLVNLDTHYQFAPGWHLFMKINNLLDRTNYRTFGILAQNMYTAQSELAVVPSQPIGVWIGLSYEFGTDGSSSRGRD